MKETNRVPRASWQTYLAILGPGIAVAATGVGAGDMFAASVSGGRYGFAVVWAAG
ncbi:divalent metal cation transporter, partial [Candidatus Poribacteria bacterium]|nr:divalent metal cation transporter [Candidatus Poribacteria bacterium]